MCNLSERGHHGCDGASSRSSILSAAAATGLVHAIDPVSLSVFFFVFFVLFCFVEIGITDG